MKARNDGFQTLQTQWVAFPYNFPPYPRVNSYPKKGLIVSVVSGRITVEAV